MQISGSKDARTILLLPACSCNTFSMGSKNEFLSKYDSIPSSLTLSSYNPSKNVINLYLFGRVTFQLMTKKCCKVLCNELLKI